jgi:hypothetical protein
VIELLAEEVDDGLTTAQEILNMSARKGSRQSDNLQ